MKIGKQGLELIKSFEGLELTAYMPTPIDVPTIGYGHTKTVEMGQTITKAKAEALLKQDLAWVEAAVSRHVNVPLTQAQYDALCSFVYNLGSTNFRRSTLLKRLNEGNYQDAADELLRWNRQGPNVLRGLTRRREAERALFMSVGTPSVPNTPPAPVGGLLGALMAFLATFLKNRS